MRKNKLVLLSAVVAAFAAVTLVSSCSKKTDNTGSVTDSYVGIWNMKDTAYETHFGSVTPSSYNFTITKRDDNSVNIANFNGNPSTVFSVTANSMAYVSGASGSGASVLSTSVITRSGDHLYFTATIAYGDIKSGTATKQ